MQTRPKAMPIPPALPAPGRLFEGGVIGKCTVGSLLGSGAAGDVYRGTHTTLNVPVALKLIKREWLGDAAMVQRFIQEARLVAQLRHPNIVRVYDVGQQNGRPYIVMEFLDGNTLEPHFASQDALELPRVMRVFSDIASALGAAHDKHILHRDVKPSNIIIDHGGRAVLTDFGISETLTVDQQFTLPGHLVGTPAYMSPEQARGQRNLDARVDVFSLGLIMYELVTGAIPHESEFLLEMINARVNNDIEPVDSINPQVPKPLSQVIMKAVSRDRDERYRDGAEMSAALQEVTDMLCAAPSRRRSSRSSASTPARQLAFPTEETVALAEGVDSRYTDMNAIISELETVPGGFGMLIVHYKRRTDILFFGLGQVQFVSTWSKGLGLVNADLDTILDHFATEEHGLVEAMQISERYYNSMRASLLTSPLIGGMRASFIELERLIEYCQQGNQSGVLRIFTAEGLGFIVCRPGEPLRFFCSSLLGNLEVDGLAPLQQRLERFPNALIDFYSLDSAKLSSSELPPLDGGISDEAVNDLVDFAVDMLHKSGVALNKQFGLGSSELMRKYFERTANEFPQLFSELELDPDYTVDKRQLLWAIRRLPRTGRGRILIPAVTSLIVAREQCIRDALPKRRKCNKALAGLLDACETHRMRLSASGVDVDVLREVARIQAGL